MIALKLQQFQYNLKEKNFGAFSAKYFLCSLSQVTVPWRPLQEGGGGGQGPITVHGADAHAGGGGGFQGGRKVACKRCSQSKSVFFFRTKVGKA